MRWLTFHWLSQFICTVTILLYGSEKQVWLTYFVFGLISDFWQHLILGGCYVLHWWRLKSFFKFVTAQTRYKKCWMYQDKWDFFYVTNRVAGKEKEYKKRARVRSGKKQKYHAQYKVIQCHHTIIVSPFPHYERKKTVIVWHWEVVTTEGIERGRLTW